MKKTNKNKKENNTENGTFINHSPTKIEFSFELKQRNIWVQADFAASDFVISEQKKEVTTYLPYEWNFSLLFDVCFCLYMGYMDIWHECKAKIVAHWYFVWRFWIILLHFHIYRGRQRAYLLFVLSVPVHHFYVENGEKFKFSNRKSC